MAEILLTGFEAFGRFADNPSRRIVEHLHGKSISGAQIEGLVLPVEFGRDMELVLQALNRREPRLVLSLGLAAAAPCLQVERIAINLRISDRGEVPIIEGGPAAYFARLNAEEVAREVVERGVPEISGDVADADAVLQQVGRVAMAQGVQGDGLLEPAG